MFEIGSSLREARRRQGLELDDVVHATLIRARFLEALENERFDLLPDGFYRRSFLRRYADFLGLDGDTFVEEFELRFAAAHPEPEGEPARRSRRLGDLASAGRGPLAAIVAVALVGVGVWALAGSAGSGAVHGTAKKSTVQHQLHDRPPRTAPRVSKKRLAPVATATAPPVLRLTAARGSCWLEVRVGSSNGRTVVTRTLEPGQHLTLGLRRQLWIRLGAPWNLDAELGARSITRELPPSSGNVLASTRGMQTAA
jgi:cytoskeleton protein RodZ